MRTFISLFALVYSGAALGYESEPADVWFSDTFELLNVAQFDSGWLPAEDPFGVRFYVQPSGGIVTDIPATSHVMWPEVLEHSFESYNGLGVFGIDTSLEMVAQVNIDIVIYQDTFDLWAETFAIEKLTTFDGLLLPGSDQEHVEIEVSDQSLIPPIEFELPIIIGVDLAFDLEIYPEFVAKMTGERIDTAHDGGIATISEFDGTADLDLPQSDPGMLGLNSIYHGFLSGDLNLVLKPTLSLETIIGDFDILTFEFPITMLNISDSRAFEPVEMTHPLPSLETTLASHNFGELTVGDTATVELDIANTGALGAVGELFIEGSADFAVSQDQFVVKAGKTRTVTITYTPTAEGDETAMLYVESNDPARPEISIPLGGGAVDSVDPTNYDEALAGGGKSTIQTCGCAAQTIAPMTSVAWLPLLGLLGLRRRQA
jgi:hypothetical protein